MNTKIGFVKAAYLCEKEKGRRMIREQFEEILTSTGRKGIEQVIAKLGELGFFEAPASSRFHLSCKGGLLEHSVNVYKAAMLLREAAINARPELEEQLPSDSVAIWAG